MVDDGPAGPAGAGWRADPWGTYELRYFDGVAFTDQVSTAGQVATDPFFDAAAPLPPPTAPKRSVLPWVVLALVLLAAVVGIALIVANDDDGDEVPEDTTTIEEETTTTPEDTTTIEEETTTTPEETTTTEEPTTTTAAP